MKMLNKKFVRTLSCAAVAVCAAAMLSVGAFAAEVDPTCVEGYLPPQEQMVQGDIALHSADVAVGEKDPSYGGYGAPEGNPIQGNIMLISGDELADTAKTEARYTVKGLLGKQLLYTARQKGGVLTLDVPAEVATFRTTIEDMQALQASGVKTLVLVTEKNTTTLNLSLLCEGQKSGTRVTLRHLGSSATLCYLWAGHLLVSWARWPAPAAHGLAGLLALLAAYAGHCFWTFGIRSGDHARMLPRFVLVQGAGLWLGDLFARGLGWCGVPHGLALPAASLAAPLFLYLLCRLWVFRPVRSMNLSPPSSRGTSMHHVPISEAPVVSVIMNCLNSSEHLQETLDSLAAQTFTDFEVIFWDNGSTDSSPQIARGHAGLAGRLRYFRGEETVPLGAARNLAIARSRGRYVAFLDCDDLWRPEKLARQVACFEADPHVGLVSTDTEIFDGKHVLKRLFAESRPQRGKAFAALMERQWISMSSAMLSRAALDSVVCPPAREGGAPVWFDESLNVCEEADIFYRVAHDWELDHVDAPLTLWRVQQHHLPQVRPVLGRDPVHPGKAPPPLARL